ncbi:MAG: acetyl-CoA carboxylase biotin carboxyl carrier protein [Deltaproteobacteria bacterium]|nr:acetyl-CoA carboxylase biotin carboxyl carrier protein [Deltaproteobacteria bacterium]
MAVDLKTLEKLLGLVKKHKLAELEVEDGKSKFRIKTALGARLVAEASSAFGQPVGSHGAVAHAHDAPPLAESPKKLSGSGKSDDERYTKVLSPFVGTFYRAPSPEADAYVKDGQMVKKGDVLCIVEAMKLMNEIESEVNGKIVSVLAENGQPVEYGEPLFLIDPV